MTRRSARRRFRSEETTGEATYRKRLLSHTRTLYSRNDRSGPLAFEAVESLALVWQSSTKAFTADLIAATFGTKVTDAILVEGGYLHLALDDDDAWWMPSGRTAFAGPESFYLPTTFFDPFGNTSTIAYDDYHLAVVQATDPLGNTVLAEYDYRVLAPVHVTDANGNRAAAQVDELGRVVATAIMGKEGDTDGDTLEDPTTTFTYDLTRFATTGEPNMVYSRAREQHGAANLRWQEAYSYSDGSGREVMRKIQAEPGLAPERDGVGALVHDGEGALVFAACDPRWVGTGRTVFDNKGNPVKQYEPFFSSTHAYEEETQLVEWGVTPVLRYDALGRLIRTDLPNGTFSKIDFDPWKQTTFDPNDNVAPLDLDDTAGESLWYQARKGLDPDTDPEGRAATLARAHRGTPGVAHLDALGRTFLTIEDNGPAGAYATRLVLDVEGNPRVITDARLNTAMEHTFGMGGRVLQQKSCDAGERWMLSDVGGALLRAWDARLHTKRATYDAARRPTHQYVQQGVAAEQLVGRTVYGEAHPDAAALNLRGKPYQVYDGAGVVTSGAYDFKGNLLAGSRRLASNYRAVADWSPLAGLTDIAAIATAAEALLEAEDFTSATTYDALNRRTSMTAPDASEIRPTYNEAGLLEKVEARVRGAVSWTTFVDDIDYDAKGQREKIVYGNGTRTTYTYDPATFRLVRLKTVRDSDDAVLQNLTYTYDPVGNITEIKDSAQQTVFFDNDVVSPSTQYVYDALYRLIEASGREHAGGVADVQRDQNDVPLLNLPHANDALALRNYVEKYVYDAVGNLLKMSHETGAVDWTRRYEIEATSNRLLSTSLPGDEPTATHFSATYAYDEHGSMTSMPHLPAIGWDHNDQMQEVDLGGGGTAYYTYDAAGQRVRKVWEHSGLVEERVYLGGWEVYRKRDSLGNLLVERETLHGRDGARRVVLVETTTVDVDAVGVFTPSSRVRFQLDNHLGSASLEVEESGLVIGYEEYHLYGTTAYASGRSGAEVSGKRYRYTGKERDEETGLYYHGARHYAAWLGRWTAVDPVSLLDGPNLYAYVHGEPVAHKDPSGTQTTIPKSVNPKEPSRSAPRSDTLEPWSRPPPPPAEVKAVQDAIDRANLLTDEAKNLEQQARDARRRADYRFEERHELELKDISPTQEGRGDSTRVRGEGERSGLLGQEDLYKKETADRKEAERLDSASIATADKARLARQEAIDLAIKVYRIDTSAVKSVKYDPVVTEKGHEGEFDYGQAKIGEDAFTTAGFLASIISHEAELHGKQARDGFPRAPDVDSTARKLQEISAWDWNIGNAKRFGLAKEERQEFMNRREKVYNTLSPQYKARVNKGIMTQW